MSLRNTAVPTRKQGPHAYNRGPREASRLTDKERNEKKPPDYLVSGIAWLEHVSPGSVYQRPYSTGWQQFRWIWRRFEFIQIARALGFSTGYRRSTHARPERSCKPSRLERRVHNPALRRAL